jgi:hypothetical protein
MRPHSHAYASYIDILFRITIHQEYTSQQVSAILIQASFRMLVAVKKRRQLSTMYRAESILNLEKGGVLAIQDRWRQFLNRRRISEDMIVSERIIFENRAATAIVSVITIIQTTSCVVFIVLYNITCPTSTQIASALSFSNPASVDTEIS